MFRTLPLLWLLVACSAKPLESVTTEPTGNGGSGSTDDSGVDIDRDGVDASADCDDQNSAVYPGADEVCDGLDNDCDDAVDEDVLTTWYTDADADGYGDQPLGSGDCDTPEGAVTAAGDCDDGDATISPGALEVCDGVDNDCDGAVDDNATDATTWYTDADNDGYGDPDSGEWTCTPSGSAVSNALDCDDGDPSTAPGAAEVCDGVDNDCDGSADEDATDGSTWYSDVDADGYGDPASATLSCERPAGMTDEGGDCDDLDPSTYPAADEICDGLDNDCDGATDEEPVDGDRYYGDADEDGFGEVTDEILACELPDGAVADATDCDDTDDASYPGADELCDGADNDCDSLTDEDPVDGATWYEDTDDDGYGDPDATIVQCTLPDGASSASTDCDDGDDTIHPGASETCDGVDEDCDGLVDDSPVDASTWYADADADGYGDPSDGVSACASSGGRVSNDDDCDDSSAGVSPSDAETCDGVDQDCDGYVDDGDVCDCSIEYYGEHAYQLCKTEKKWTSARSSCNSDGYELLTIDDSSESAWVYTTTLTYSTSKYWWTGYNDRSREGTWEWDDGSASTYTNWYPGEPNDSGGEDCAELNRFGDARWNDADCDDKKYYICESF